MARLALVEELSVHSNSNRAMLEHQQFDLVVRLLNNALQVLEYSFGRITGSSYGRYADYVTNKFHVQLKYFTFRENILFEYERN